MRRSKRRKLLTLGVVFLATALVGHAWRSSPRVIKLQNTFLRNVGTVLIDLLPVRSAGKSYYLAYNVTSLNKDFVLDEECREDPSILFNTVSNLDLIAEGEDFSLNNHHWVVCGRWSGVASLLPVSSIQ